MIFAVGAIAHASNSNADGDGRRSIHSNGQIPAITAAGARKLTFPLLISGLLVALMIGLRFEVGADWLNYLLQFNDMNEKSFGQALSRGDPGYNALSWLAWQAGAGIWFVNLTCSTIFVWGLLRLAKDQDNPWLVIGVAVPYLIIVVGMGYTRQAVAIGLSMLGLSAVLRGSFNRFVVCVLIATLFHRSAVILLPVVALAYSRNRLQALVIGAVGCAVGYYILTRAEGLQNFQKIYIRQGLQSAGTAIRLGMNAVPALIYVFQSKRFSADEQERRLWLVFAIMALLSIVAGIFAPSSTALDRLALYIIPVQLFVFGNLPRAFPHTSVSVLTTLVLVYSATVEIVWFEFADNAHAWVPYAFGR
jgi:hypothetical protein